MADKHTLQRHAVTVLFFEWRNYFCRRTLTSIYVVIDQKLPTTSRGSGVVDDLTANTLIKKPKYLVSLKVACPLQLKF